MLRTIIVLELEFLFCYMEEWASLEQTNHSWRRWRGLTEKVFSTLRILNKICGASVLTGTHNMRLGVRFSTCSIMTVLKKFESWSISNFRPLDRNIQTVSYFIIFFLNYRNIVVACTTLISDNIFFIRKKEGRESQSC